MNVSDSTPRTTNPRPWGCWRLVTCLAAIAMLSACETRSPTAPGPATPDALTISVQPQSQSVPSGSSVTLTVGAAGGSGSPSYQWYAGMSGNVSALVAGATTASYTTPALSATASYWVRVSDSTGSVDSTTAVITVTAPASLPFEDEVLVLVNQRRAAGATCGSTAYSPVPALYMHPQLQEAARGHSQDMAALNYFSHTSADGRTFSQRIRAAGYTASPIGENIAAGYTTPNAVVAGWMSSSGHCANIMSSAYRAIGVGYALSAASQYRHYWTQNFGGS